ncbi:MAG: hypothetical protein K2W95_15755 [Candidatus Obscuribacterales bacterium]|nr:hypothetical protein [Candidatus Obscuribacterales bacterium]
MQWIHDVMQQAQQQVGDVKLVLFGHISSYDPTLHAVRVIIPQYRDSNDSPLETSWIPLGTLAVGNGFGIQYAPKGGATASNPGDGEQCAVLVFNRGTGLMASAQLFFNDLMVPPGNGDNETQDYIGAQSVDPYGRNMLEAGELVMRHQSGSFIKMYDDGQIQVVSRDNLSLHAERDVNLIMNNGSLFSDAFDQTDIQTGTNMNLTAGHDVGVAAVGNVELDGTNVDTTAGTDVRINADSGVSLSARMGQISPAPGNIQMQAENDIEASSLGDFLFLAGLHVTLNAKSGGMQISTGNSVGSAVAGNIDLDSVQDINLIATRDIISNTRNHLLRSQTGRFTIATANESIPGGSTANDICVLSDDDVRIRARNGVSITSGSRDQDPAADDIDIMADDHVRIHTQSGGIAIGALQDPRSLLLTGDIYIASNGKLTIEGAGPSTALVRMRSVHQSVSIYTGSTSDATGKDIKISSEQNLTLETRGFSSSNIAINAPNGMITIYAQNVNTNIRIGANGPAHYNLLTKYLWDNYLSNHTHSGVVAGGANTGGPVGVPTMVYPYCTNTLAAN